MIRLEVEYSDLDINEWLPRSNNEGWLYRNKVSADFNCKYVIDFFSCKYIHSRKDQWIERLAAGQISLNGKKITNDRIIITGDELCWQRPSWREDAVPSIWEVIFDNGDFLIINKPSGLPVTPGGGFLEHTLTSFFRKYFYISSKEDIPCPVHRLGRFTSGLLVCSRRSFTRSKISKVFFESTKRRNNFQKIYRGLACKNPGLNVGDSILIDTPIVQRSHSILGRVWAPYLASLDEKNPISKGRKLDAYSLLKILERRENADLVQISILTGRPHQIRIHLASIGTPLKGDSFYKCDRTVSELSTPGNGGYCLHSYKIVNLPISNHPRTFSCLPPKILQTSDELGLNII